MSSSTEPVSTPRRSIPSRRIYLASSWKNQAQPKVVAALREAGHDVYDFRNPEDGDTGFDWREIDVDYGHWTAAQYLAALEHPLAQKSFQHDHAAMEWANTFVLLLPCGRSAHLEAGWGAGAGKQVFILCDEDPVPELMYLEASALALDLPELLEHLRRPVMWGQRGESVRFGFALGIALAEGPKTSVELADYLGTSPEGVTTVVEGLLGFDPSILIVALGPDRWGLQSPEGSRLAQVEALLAEIVRTELSAGVCKSMADVERYAERLAAAMTRAEDLLGLDLGVQEATDAATGGAPVPAFDGILGQMGVGSATRIAGAVP